MILEPGKLYRISRHFWYLFPTSELAVESLVAVADTAADASIGASFASRRIKQSNNKVTFMNEGEGFLVVSSQPRREEWLDKFSCNSKLDQRHYYRDFQ